MAHFAKIDNFGIVVFVTVGRDEDNELELCAKTGDTYRKTSYNTRGGIHYDAETGLPSEDQTKAFRKNFAGIGYQYDQPRDAFIPPKPFNSWLLNEETCQWIPPMPYPDDGKQYYWDESTKTWIEAVE